MKHFFHIAIFLFLVSCTSNTIYKKPKNLVPKDSMIALLTDMYIASSAKNVKNKFLKREKNYMALVYEKYKIDSTRFDVSNDYYTSKIEEYTDMLKKVQHNIDSLQKAFTEQRLIKDSLNNKTNKKPNKKLSLELMKKNEKLLKNEKIELKDFDN